MIIQINGKNIEALDGETVLSAASRVGTKIPTLCYLKGVSGGSCGICEIEADGKIVRACICKVKDGMNVNTDTSKVRESRKERLLKLAEDHRFDCETCSRCMDCEFIRLLNEYGIYDYEYQRLKNDDKKIALAGNIVFDDSQCIGCRRCAAVCKDGSVTVQRLGDGFKAAVDPEKYTGSGESVAVCPTAAFHLDEKDEIRAIRRAIHDKTCYMIVSPDAAAVFGELLFDPPGTESEGRLAAILRKLGFTKVYIAGSNRSVADISAVIKQDPDIVTVSVSTITGPVRPGADIDITIQTLRTIFRRACVSRTTMIKVWRNTPAEEFDRIDVSGNSAEYSFGGAMPHRDCYTANMNDLDSLRRENLSRIIKTYS